MNPSPAAELLPESPTSQIPTPIPSPIPKIPTPTQGEILDLEPVGLTLSSEILPAEATIELVLDEACDLTGRVMPDFSGGWSPWISAGNAKHP